MVRPVKACLYMLTTAGHLSVFFFHFRTYKTFAEHQIHVCVLTGLTTGSSDICVDNEVVRGDR